MPLPQWTTRITDDEVGGEDHLGFEGAAQSYQQWLVPGIITTTGLGRKWTGAQPYCILGSNIPTAQYSSLTVSGHNGSQH